MNLVQVFNHSLILSRRQKRDGKLIAKVYGEVNLLKRVYCSEGKTVSDASDGPEGRKPR